MDRSGVSDIPPDYTTPPFPSIWISTSSVTGDGSFLYYATDIWRFTVLWTLIVYGGFHLAASSYAFSIQWRNWKYMWIVSLIYVIIGGVEALLAGSIVGLM